MKIRMQEHIRNKAQEFRQIKNEVKIEVAQEEYELLEEKQQEVMKQREIKKILTKCLFFQESIWMNC